MFEEYVFCEKLIFGKYILGKSICDIWALNIMFDDHLKLLILSDKVLEVIDDGFWNMCVCFHDVVYKFFIFTKRPLRHHNNEL